MKVMCGWRLADLDLRSQGKANEPDIAEAMRCERMNNRCKRRSDRIESAMLSHIALTHQFLGALQ